MKGERIWIIGGALLAIGGGFYIYYKIKQAQAFGGEVAKGITESVSKTVDTALLPATWTGGLIAESIGYTGAIIANYPYEAKATSLYNQMLEATGLARAEE